MIRNKICVCVCVLKRKILSIFSGDRYESPPLPLPLSSFDPRKMDSKTIYQNSNRFDNIEIFNRFLGCPCL